MDLCDGIRGWFRTNVVKLNDGIALSLRDVTSRKQREDALTEIEHRFRLLADAIDDVFWILDLHHQRIVYVSPAYERVWAFSRDALERDPKAWRQNLHPEDRSLADPVFEEMRRGHRHTFEPCARHGRRLALGARQGVACASRRDRAGGGRDDRYHRGESVRGEAAFRCA